MTDLNYFLKNEWTISLITPQVMTYYGITLFHYIDYIYVTKISRHYIYFATIYYPEVESRPQGSRPRLEAKAKDQGPRTQAESVLQIKRS